MTASARSPDGAQRNPGTACPAFRFASCGLRNSLKLHLRRLIERLALLANVEELARPEAEHSGEQRGRELLDARVVLLHGVVEEPPRRRELVLDVGEFGLQLLEIGIGLEVRVGLGEREQLTQG